MSTYSYDKSSDELTLVAGTPRSKLNGINNKAEAAVVNEASPFEVRSSSNPYKVGDLVIYRKTGVFPNGDNKLYECTTQHYGNWNASNFTAVTIGDKLVEIINLLNSL